MKEKYFDLFNQLSDYIIKNDFKGYDPYDTLNSIIPFEKFGRYPAAVVTQIQKKNPINIRPLIGVRPGINPKGMGLILKAYSILAKADIRFKQKADLVFDWLKNNISEGYSGACWGYNFDWVNPTESLPAYTPSVVVTSFVIDGIFEYYRLTNSKKAAELIQSGSEYILRDIPITEYETGLSFSYTHLSKGSCYNASLLAAEILGKFDYINKTDKNFVMVRDAVKFVLSMQKDDGSWFYSYYSLKNTERKQIDFHQGFILVSLENLRNLYHGKIEFAIPNIHKGLKFYHDNQFAADGRAKWRLPKEYPTDIHNQTQGIITFSRLANYGVVYRKFADVVADYTIENFRDSSAYFYYRRGRFWVNKISYMRWSQAWMLLALAELIFSSNAHE